MKTFAFDKTERCMVIACGQRSPDDAEWEQFLEFLRGHIRGGGKPHLLVFDEGKGPTASQRAKVTKILQDAPDVRAAVVTGSQVVRGVVTAFSWFFREIRSFSPDEFDLAARHLGLSEAEGQVVRRLAERLRQRTLETPSKSA